MAKVHTVVQGETLTRIAKKYGFSSIDPIYQHERNAKFRKLRPDPAMLSPGDKVHIPDMPPQSFILQPGRQHVFVVKTPPKEVFRLKLEDQNGDTLAGMRVSLAVGDSTIDAPVDEEGVVSLELPHGDETVGSLSVFVDEASELPSHTFEISLGHLDPVETLSGVQARCNALNFDCGVADGLMGKKTRAGVKAFQAAYALDVDGIPGPQTKGKLKEVYGS